MTTIQLPVVDQRPLWRVAQLIGILCTVILIGSLVRWPDPSLNILWNMVVPILPAVFLINPMIWRNVCPLATLNNLTGDRTARAGLSTSVLVGAWGVGIVLLLTMVPARRFLFNVDGVVLAATIAVVGVLAIGMGVFVARRGGFCNALCPVLPVEKLYGQAPLISVGSARCNDCNLCTAAGCIDLAGRKSARQSVQQGAHVSWMLNPFGLFAAAFPGFIIGYFATTDGTISSAGAVYGTVAIWAALSLILVLVLVALSRAKPTTVLPLLGGLAAGLYYWFAAPGLATAYYMADSGAIAIRILTIGLVSFWLVRALRRDPA
jgi:nitrite reductase (NADH) large subunit